MFEQESEIPPKWPNGPTITVFKHKWSGFRAVFANVATPLCSAAVVVPTFSSDDKGLPHTLEHLIFTGSQNFPMRGYLDSLAIRCLSTGTNAYTTEDHTAYTISTAGSQGLIDMFNVFLDHILRPTLRPNQFLAEVVHIDGSAKYQGVVYCEMAGRENTEGDLVDLHLRRLLYDRKGTYAFECGGLTPDIKTLTNEEIKSYHERYYNLNNITAIIAGRVDQSAFLSKLCEYDLIGAHSNGDHYIPPPFPALGVGQTHESVVSDTVKFPSSDADVGSIAYAWVGPSSSDVFEIVAIEILIRYLSDTSASPLSQAFVECANPYASELNFELRDYYQSAIFLSFSGVSYVAEGEEEVVDDELDAEKAVDDDGDEAWEDEDVEMEDADDDDDDEDDEEDDNEDDGDDDGQADHKDLFQPGVFYGRLRFSLNSVRENGFKDTAGIKAAISRHRRKWVELFETDPLDGVVGLLLPDIIRNSANPTTRVDIGLRTELFSIMDQLDQKDASFWIELLDKWFLSTPPVELFSVPDPAGAKLLQKMESAELEERVSTLGPEGLEKLDRKVKEFLEENRVNLSRKDRGAMPKVADFSGVTQLISKTSLKKFSDDGAAMRPFNDVEIIFTETVFSHFRVAINVAENVIPGHLRPYFVLFQESLFYCDLDLPDQLVKSVGMGPHVDYRDLAKKTAELLCSNEASIGFGNDLWHAAWLGETFMIGGTSNPKDTEKMVYLLIAILCFTTFTEERILTIAKNLLSELVEIKRSGDDMLSAITTRISSFSSGSQNVKFKKSTKKVGKSKAKVQKKATSDSAEFDYTNDISISVFTQEKFLKGVISAIKNGKGKKVLDDLNSLKAAILLPGSAPRGPGFVQFGYPVVPSTAMDASATALVNSFVKVWDSCMSAYLMERPTLAKGMGSSSPPIPTGFPFPRNSWSLDMVDPKFGQSIMVPIQGLGANFLSQIVACEVMRPHPHPDYFPVFVLSELLSMSEGPLFSGIRGKGYAYDGSMHMALWTGQLSFELHESSQPLLGLAEFHSIIKSLGTEDGFNQIVTYFTIESACSSVAYKLVAGVSTPSSLITTGIRSVLRGFKSLEDELASYQALFSVTKSDLKRVYDKYFVRFLRSSERVTVMTTPAGPRVKHWANEFKQKAEDEGGVSFSVVNLSDLQL
ncbi:Metalloenzyme, LuxS/M16 peptidase-like protein [Cladochytrium replicatum]|nr:Metalloenzyme, LuxS/M16 peptidase-like protein [Cladochytrium replicatum]